ncbi:MAG: Protein translocase subunit SecY [Mycoplasmataceae bacterium]|nr:MAG: Protein translocase subunit SecY [Mycoplasmataceae bacterium]
MQKNSSKDKRIRLKYWKFYSSFFLTIICLFVYFFGKKIIPFPLNGLLPIKEGSKPVTLFPSGISFHLQIGFIVNSFFSAYTLIFDNNNRNKEKLEKIKFNLSKFLKSNVFSIFWFLYHYNSESLKDSPFSYYLMIIAYLAFFVSNCFLEIIINTINDHGVCNGFNLIFFIETIPFEWLFKVFNSFSKIQLLKFGQNSSLMDIDKKNIYSFLRLLAVGLFFNWFSNLKWEVPVETNNIYFNNNNLIKTNRFKFGFRMNFGFMGIFQTSLLFKYLYYIYNIFKVLPSSEWSIKNFALEYERFDKSLITTDSPNFLHPRSNDFWNSFFALNNSNGFFINFFTNFNGGPKFIYSLSSLLFALYSINYFAIYNFNQIKPKDISEDLKKRGIYFDGIPSGKYTEIFLGKILSKLIIIWTFTAIVLNFLFDQNFSYLHSDAYKNYCKVPSFFNWFNGIGTGIDLYKQIKIKHEYIQSYD